MYLKGIFQFRYLIIEVVKRVENRGKVGVYNSVYCDHPWDYLKVVAIVGWSQ